MVRQAVLVFSAFVAFTALSLADARLGHDDSSKHLHGVSASASAASVIQGKVEKATKRDLLSSTSHGKTRKLENNNNDDGDDDGNNYNYYAQNDDANGNNYYYNQNDDQNDDVNNYNQNDDGQQQYNNNDDGQNADDGAQGDDATDDEEAEEEINEEEEMKSRLALYQVEIWILAGTCGLLCCLLGACMLCWGLTREIDTDTKRSLREKFDPSKDYHGPQYKGPKLVTPREESKIPPSKNWSNPPWHGGL